MQTSVILKNIISQYYNLVEASFGNPCLFPCILLVALEGLVGKFSYPALQLDTVLNNIPYYIHPSLITLWALIPLI